MAKRVENFRQAGRSLKHPNAKYPWTKWLKGGAWEAKEGEDFTCAPDSFVAILRAKGAEKGVRLRTRRGKNNRQKTIIIFEFYQGETVPMPPKKKVLKKSSQPKKTVKKKIVIRRTPKPVLVPEVAEDVLTDVSPAVEEESPQCPDECAEGHTYTDGCIAQILPEQRNEEPETESWDDEVSPEEDVDSTLVEPEEEDSWDDEDEESMEMEVEGSPSVGNHDNDIDTDIGAKEVREETPPEETREESGPCGECGLSNGRHTASCSKK